MPARVRRLAVRGVDYAVNEWGSPAAPLLVYLHGWGDTGATFQFVVDELARDSFVVAPDWRGFGRSSGGVASYWFPDYLADLDQLLAEYSPDDAVRLVGHSMGANVAALYAGVMPERVASLINMEGFGLADSDPADAPARYRGWIRRGRQGVALSCYADYAELAAKILERNPDIDALRAAFVARAWGRADADGRVRLRADPAHKLPNPVLYRRAEAEACWRAIEAEMLVLVGRDSRFVPRAITDGDLDSAAASFPGAALRWIEHAGHMLHFDQPAAVARHVEDFFHL